MRRLIGCPLFVIGLLLISWGLLGAVRDFSGLYSAASENPMAEPDVPEAQRGANMLGHVKVAAIGVPPLLIGMYLRKKKRSC